jgi:deoxyribose-phosphate aldolase
VKGDRDLERVERIVRCLDLTSLRPDDTDADIERLCARALRPDPDDDRLAPVAAACVLPRTAALAREALGDTEVGLAVAAGGFPDGTASTQERVAEIRQARVDGATEIDTVLDHRTLLTGDDAAVRAQLDATREAAGPATMKVILETEALPGTDTIRRAAKLAVAAGADFLKTSTGTGPVGATPEAVQVVAEEAFRAMEQGRPVGVKVAGGVRTPEAALAFLDLVESVLGPGSATPERFRIGASSLLDGLVAALRRRRTGP